MKERRRSRLGTDVERILLASVLVGGTAELSTGAGVGPGVPRESRTLIPGWTAGWPTALAREGQLGEMTWEESKIVLS